MGYTKEKASKQLDDKGKATVGPLLSALIGKLISEPYVVPMEGFAALLDPASWIPIAHLFFRWCYWSYWDFLHVPNWVYEDSHAVVQGQERDGCGQRH